MFHSTENPWSDTACIGNPPRPLLPSATKLRQGNIFTSVCQEFCPVGDVCLSACWDTPPPMQTPSPGQTPPQQTPPWRTATAADGTHPNGMLSCFSF